uniref:Uncharacterized protein n=1 Tax=Papio anubis TaxID=9555 RepID=A0A8I5NWN2_PAPAN
AQIAPLPSRLGDRARLRPKKKKKSAVGSLCPGPDGLAFPDRPPPAPGEVGPLGLGHTSLTASELQAERGPQRQPLPSARRPQLSAPFTFASTSAGRETASAESEAVSFPLQVEPETGRRPPVPGSRLALHHGVRRVLHAGAAASPEREGGQDPEGPGQASEEEAPAPAAADKEGVPRGLRGGVHQLREDHADQGADGRRRHPAAGPAVCHAGRHGPRGRAALTHDRPVRGHHRLPLPAAARPHRVLLRHPGRRGSLGSRRARAGREPPRGGAPETQRSVHTAQPAAARPAPGLHGGGSQQGGPRARVSAAWVPASVSSPCVHWSRVGRCPVSSCEPQRWQPRHRDWPQRLYPVGSGLLGRTLMSSGRPEAERGLWHPHPGSYSPTEPNAVPVSALLGHGLQELKAELDAAVLKATGRQILTLRVRLAGAQLSWLYKEATVRSDGRSLRTAPCRIATSSSA